MCPAYVLYVCCMCTAVHDTDKHRELQLQESQRKHDAYFTPLLHDAMCFEAHVWPSLGFQHIELTEIMRQKDTAFVKLLQGVRKGGEECQVRVFLGM